MNIILIRQMIEICLTSLKSDSHFSKHCFICFDESPFKMMKNAFCFILKALSVLKIFRFLSWLVGHIEKTAWLQRSVNFKVYGVTTWLTNNYNTRIVQYLTKNREPDKEIWSFHRRKQDKYFSSKIIEKRR